MCLEYFVFSGSYLVELLWNFRSVVRHLLLQCLLRTKLKKDRGKVLFVAILWRNGMIITIVLNVEMI